MSAAITDPTARVKKYATVDTAQTFARALKQLHRGDHIIYHKGFLLADRDMAPSVDIPTIRERARKAWRSYRDGKVTLIQYRKGFGEFEYHAVLL
jgi:hypothetical protein